MTPLQTLRAVLIAVLAWPTGYGIVLYRKRKAEERRRAAAARQQP